MKKYICIFAPVLIIALLIAVVSYAGLKSPLMQEKMQLRKENAEIREYVLGIVPLGTNVDDAKQIISDHNSWYIDWFSDEHGYGLDANGNPSGYEDIMVGEKAMRVHLGEYSGILITTDVTAFLGFDDAGVLIDVAIRKDHDSL